MTLSLLTIICTYLGILVHPFHVSVSEIFHNQENASLEITMKIFTDDLENALRRYGKYDIYLDDNFDDPAISQLLRDYLSNNFGLIVNEREVEANFLGAEGEIDAVWCYLEVEGVKKIKTIQISNSVLLELFPDQVNLVHVDYQGKIKSLQLDYNAFAGTLSTDNW